MLLLVGDVFDLLDSVFEPSYLEMGSDRSSDDENRDKRRGGEVQFVFQGHGCFAKLKCQI